MAMFQKTISEKWLIFLGAYGVNDIPPMKLAKVWLEKQFEGGT